MSLTPQTERAPRRTTTTGGSLPWNDTPVSPGPRPASKTPVPERRLERAPDPLDEKIRRIQESIHEEDPDSRPSVTVIVGKQGATVPPESKPPVAKLIGKVVAIGTAGVALFELVRQVYNLVGGQ